MVSVIVFTKDRPMQLHAYLESLFYFSDLKESQVFIIYKQNEKISYKNVKKEYPKCSWILESNFYDDLLTVINKSSEYILFGCDDVVYKNKILINYAENLLLKNEGIFGYSFRLGTNIKPVPKTIMVVDEHIEWNWNDVSEGYYNYPWELVGTLYRKVDVLSLLNNADEKITNPNYLEGAFAVNPRNYINRAKLACFNGTNQALIITVNRVQDTHPMNSVDSSGDTDIYYLNSLYNEKNKKLDIKKISQLKNNDIHVGSEYFILEGDSFIKWNPVIHSIKMLYKRILFHAKKLVKNIIFLLKSA